VPAVDCLLHDRSGVEQFPVARPELVLEPSESRPEPSWVDLGAEQGLVYDEVVQSGIDAEASCNLPRVSPIDGFGCHVAS